MSVAEHLFVVAGVREDVRTDGRGCLDARPLSVACGVLPQANGSARVKRGDAHVLASVKMELVRPDSGDGPSFSGAAAIGGSGSRGSIECAVDCWASSSPKFARRGALDVSNELTATLTQIFSTSGALDVERLCVVPGRWCWHAAVDVCVLEGSGGSLIDLCALAAAAALYDARVPRLRLVQGETASDVGVELDEDHPDGDTVPFPATERLPAVLTLTQVGGVNLVDATEEEEACGSSKVVVAMDRSGRICALTCDCEEGVEPSLVHGAAEGARHLAPALFRQLDRAVSASDTGADGDEGW